MELVYLWVEDYKNIKRQGFNFSPRFRCEFKAEYDENNKLKDDCELIIDENKDYVSILPDNINITAIVGENGSGKSSIQELFFYIIYLTHRMLYKDYSITDAVLFENFKLNSFLIIYCEEEKIIHKLYLRDICKNTMEKESLFSSYNEILDQLSAHSNNIQIKCSIPNINISSEFNKIDFYSIYFNYSFDTWISPTHISSWIDNIYHRKDNYMDIPLLLEPDKSDRIINIKNITYLNMQKMFKFYSELFDKTEIIKKFFVPNKIYFQLDREKIIKKIENHMNKISSSKEERKKLATTWIKYLNNLDDLISINKVYLLFKLFESYIYSKNVEETTDLNFVLEYLKNDLKNENPKDYIDKLPIDRMNSFKYILNEKIQDCIDFHNAMNFNIERQSKYNELLDKKIDLNKAFQIYDKLNPWVYVIFYDNNKNYNSLSSGEKSLLNFSTNMMYQIYNISKYTSYSVINLFLDEVELNMHPEWQKSFLINIFSYLNLFPNKRFNLILTSHSPFILSDIPKENIIFLEKGKQVYPFEDGKQTFGANIHTLLSHGFFMKDGLMGEFAKDKINSIISYHEELLKKELTKEENKKQRDEEKEKYKNEYKTKFKQIQSIIGDDYLKQVVKNHLVEIEKIVLGNDEAKEEEIKRLKAQIELLEK